MNTREAWLTSAIAELEAKFPGILRARGPVRVSCSWPSARITEVLGQCFPEKCSGDKTIEICISMALADPVEVVATLAHELLHASLPPDTGHRGDFPAKCKELGLEGKPTATKAGAEFKEAISGILNALGPYPHAPLNPGLGKAKQTTRMLKLECPGCGYVVRTTQKWIDVALPICGAGCKSEEGSPLVFGIGGEAE